MGYRYIGSKSRIVDDIIEYLGPPSIQNGVFVDGFSGTGIVASRAADLGWPVKINDMMSNATVVSEAHLISADDVSFSALGGYDAAVSTLQYSRKKGFIWREYSPASLVHSGIERKYFSEENAIIIDGAVELIHLWKKQGVISDKEFSLLMATLIYAVNDVANIAGTYGCFLSSWTPQACKTIDIAPLKIREKKVDYSVSNCDVFQLNTNPADVLYLDPPYTKRQYASYYHILETIVKGDEPVVEGVAGLRPWKNHASVFCYKKKALGALVDLIASQKANRVLLSYSNDGHVQLEDLKQHLEVIGSVDIVEMGSIGRYRPNQTASSNASEVKEYLIDCRKDVEY